VLRFLLKSAPARRLARGLPVVALLSVVEIASAAGEHLAKLDPVQRRRLITLLGKARGGRASLNAVERRELAELAFTLEPRRFAGSAADKLSPVWLPRRLLYGRKPRPDRRRTRSRL
jgi:hypothetical protein